MKTEVLNAWLRIAAEPHMTIKKLETLIGVWQRSLAEQQQ